MIKRLALALGVLGGVLGLSASPSFAQNSPAQPEVFAVDAETVVDGIDIRHLRGLAQWFGAQTDSEQILADQVLLSANLENQPIFNLLGTTCQSPDKTSDCKALVVRALFSPGETPYTNEQANILNNELAVSKATVLSDGRLQIDRLMIVTGGVTMQNLADNMSQTYSSFGTAQSLLN